MFVFVIKVMLGNDFYDFENIVDGFSSEKEIHIYNGKNNEDFASRGCVKIYSELKI